MVYAFLVQKIDVRAKTHSGVIKLFNLHIIAEGLVEKSIGSFFQFMFEKGNGADYGDLEILKAEDVLPLISQAEEFIKAIQKLIV